jgi:hypothetical protein
MLAPLILKWGLPAWTGKAIMIAAIAGAVGWGYWSIYNTGYKSAASKCESERLRIELAEKDSLIRKYKDLLAATELQRVSEGIEAAERERLIQDRLTSLAAEKALADLGQAELERDLTALIQDKGKLDAVLAKLRQSRGNCGASDADVELDGRLLRGTK